MRGSWQENVQKLQLKFSNVHSVIPKVQKLYLDKNPNDETIKQLFSSKQTNKTNNTNKTNKPNKPNKTNKNINKISRKTLSSK